MPYAIPTERLVASVVVDKFAWHNPLYRPAQIVKLQGLPVGRVRSSHRLRLIRYTRYLRNTLSPACPGQGCIVR